MLNRDKGARFELGRGDKQRRHRRKKKIRAHMCRVCISSHAIFEICFIRVAPALHGNALYRRRSGTDNPIKSYAHTQRQGPLAAHVALVVVERRTRIRCKGRYDDRYASVGRSKIVNREREPEASFHSRR